ncbi:MAG: IS110 family transposase [Acidobacteria bacterium]|nr:IS110 family transposase [Acidobacteriota bacterium]
METVYVGLDIGSSSFHQLIMLPDGSTNLNRRFQMSEANLRTAFSALGADIHVHMEAGELAPWVRSVIAPLVKRVVISHPQANAWIAKDPNKGDRIDAFKLADLLRMNRFTPVYYATDESRRVFKQLVQHYDELTAQQARLRCRIKARLRVQGIIRRDASLFSTAGREPVLRQVSSTDLRAALAQLYDLLDQARAAQRKARVDACCRARLPGDQDSANCAGCGADWRVPLLGLCADAAPLQFKAQAVALLPPVRQLPLK